MALAAVEALGAFDVGLAEDEAGAGLGELGAGDRAVELDQRRALFDSGALGEQDADNAASDLRAEDDRLVGAQGADGVDRAVEAAPLRRDGFDRDREPARRPAAARSRGGGGSTARTPLTLNVEIGGARSDQENDCGHQPTRAHAESRG
jgi:hypothetical protein